MENLTENLSITVDPETMGGIPVFRVTRVPVAMLFEYLELAIRRPKFGSMGERRCVYAGIGHGKFMLAG